METFMLVIKDEQKGASGWRINEEREKLKKATGKYLFLSILSAPLLLMATYRSSTSMSVAIRMCYITTRPV